MSPTGECGWQLSPVPDHKEYELLQPPDTEPWLLICYNSLVCWLRGSPHTSNRIKKCLTEEKKEARVTVKEGRDRIEKAAVEKEKKPFQRYCGRMESQGVF